MNTKLVSIDLAKNVFQICTYSKTGKILSNKKVRRKALRQSIAQLMEPTQITMETCYSANYWGRVFQAMGHEVNLIPAQHVKPFVRGNKNDANDAVAIAEASLRPRMRFVPVKTIEQQDIQMLHRIRQRHVDERTALVNQIRGLLHEYGIVIGKGIAQVRRRVPEVLEDATNELTDTGRAMFAELYDELLVLDERLQGYEKRLQAQYRANEVCQQLGQIEGIGPVTATAIVARVGDTQTFRNGRELAAWLGLVPRQYSTGGRTRLLGISKRGDRYLRTLLIHGGRSVIQHLGEKQDRRSRWLRQLVARRGKNVAGVALANKNARIIWALMNYGEDYRTA